MAKNIFTPELLEKHFTKNEWKKRRREFFKPMALKTCALDGEVIRGVVFSERSRESSYLTRLVFDGKSVILPVIVTVMLVVTVNMVQHWHSVLFTNILTETASQPQKKVIDKWLDRFQSSNQVGTNQISNKSHYYTF